MQMGESDELDALMEDHAQYACKDREGLLMGIEYAKSERCDVFLLFENLILKYVT